MQVLFTYRQILLVNSEMLQLQARRTGELD